MSKQTQDANAIDHGHLENENLPPPASKVGGVRHGTPTRPVSASISHHNNANHIPSPQTNVVAGWNGNEKDSTAVIDPAHFHSDKIALKDASQLPKAIASTYYPDQPHVTSHEPSHGKGPAHSTRSQAKQIQQMTTRRGM